MDRPYSASLSAAALILIVAVAGCRGPVQPSATPELPSEPLHYVIVEPRTAPEPSSIDAREWARSRLGKLALWSVDATQTGDWVVVDLGEAAIADKLDAAQMLDAVERYREPLHVVMRSRDEPALDSSGELEPPAHCSLRSVIGRQYDLDCSLAALGPLVAADWVVELEFYKPGWVRWK